MPGVRPDGIEGDMLRAIPGVDIDPGLDIDP
jgi:hypothetical protein